MKLWSRGLGKLILPFYLDKAEAVEEEDDCIIIKGRIVEKKVNWPYIIRLYPEDMIRFTHLMAYDRTVLSYIKSRLGMKFVLFVLKNVLKALIIAPLVLIENLLGWMRSIFKGGELKVQHVPAGNHTTKSENPQQSKTKSPQEGISNSKEIHAEKREVS